MIIMKDDGSMTYDHYCGGSLYQMTFQRKIEGFVQCFSAIFKNGTVPGFLNTVLLLKVVRLVLMAATKNNIRSAYYIMS